MMLYLTHIQKKILRITLHSEKKRSNYEKPEFTTKIYINTGLKLVFGLPGNH
jgi:hypothetical protein